jgi:hypothetical protein
MQRNAVHVPTLLIHPYYHTLAAAMLFITITFSATLAVIAVVAEW